MPLRDDGQVGLARLAPLRNWLPLRTWRSGGLRRQVGEIVDASRSLRDVSDGELQARGVSLHEEIRNGKALDAATVPAFALAREASRRLLGMEHYPVQLMAGLALHRGHVVQMATGEGKTLAATAPALLNAFADRGVHVVTVNDYLAERDAEEMGPVYRFFGLTVGTIVHETAPGERRAAYRSSVAYATNKELGFDFLRDEDNQRRTPWFQFGMRAADVALGRVQRNDWHFAIVDEADSILIDDARTPLILAAAPAEDAALADECANADRVAKGLREREHFALDRKAHRLEWLKAGLQRVTHQLGSQRGAGGRRVDWHEAVLRALKAHHLFHRDVEYVVEDEEVVIVDENTGRKMPGRQWEEGIHQAVACKEGLPIKGETHTLARTTYQLYFNRYEKLSGMTGTAWTDAKELAAVYGRGTVVVPTHRPCIRKMQGDLIFGSEAAKWKAAVARIAELHLAGRPVLVGTRSIEKSEHLSAKLTEAAVPHVVLNARHEAEEAAIVADAGRQGRVTVATNMAGRGTDIKLSPGVAGIGGLFVLGTERHESRRVDLQLIGRCARQGDPGEAQFFLSVEDPLIRRHRPRAAERLAARYASEERPIEGSAIRRFFRGVQSSIERRHRKQRFQLIRQERESAKTNRLLGIE